MKHLVFLLLLLGSVFVGWTILQNIHVTSTVSAIRSVQTAVLTYSQNYGALPGDDHAAEIRFPTQGLTHGGGDGLIGSTTLAETFTVSKSAAGNGPDESANLWQHLRAAGMAKGPATESNPPTNTFGGVIGVQNGAFAGNGFALGTNVVCASRIPGAAARTIDQRMDDGKALTGKMRGGDAVNAAASEYTNGKTYVVCIALEEPKR
jgi:hypothetical protein